MPAGKSTISRFDHLDLEGLGSELKAVRRNLDDNREESDVRHLKKIVIWGRLCSLFGLASAWIVPNPISALLMSQGSFTRWTMVAHHVMHRGYDKIPGIPRQYTSHHFARGWRRFIDWFDWILPDAWDHEHNVFHHYYTGELTDPDLVERNVDFFRNWRAPIAIKAVVILFFMCTWKLLYYAPNTSWILHQVQARRQKERAEQGRLRSIIPDNHRPVTTLWLLLPFRAASREFWRRSVLPYGMVRFVLTPLMFLPLGTWAAASVLLNLVLAEILTNLHTFLMIVPSHAAHDLYRFENPARSRNEFYVRQIIGTANYRCGGDFNDFLHGWLNYQIEHHLWPDLSMRQYQKVQPQVKSICERYGLPYRQGSVFARLGKTWRILLGTESMRLAETSITSNTDSSDREKQSVPEEALTR